MGRWRWLESTDKLQRETYGYGNLFEIIEADPEAEIVVKARDYYLMWNAFAAMIEVAELAQEFSWKPWAKDASFMNPDRMMKEAVDVNHFIGNILVVAGVDDEKYEEAYQAKQQINRDRAASGSYSAKKGGLAHGSD